MITQEQLFVGETYTDISNELRTITYIDLSFVRYVRADGKARTAPLEVMLDVLTVIPIELKLAA